MARVSLDELNFTSCVLLKTVYLWYANFVSEN